MFVCGALPDLRKNGNRKRDEDFVSVKDSDFLWIGSPMDDEMNRKRVVLMRVRSTK